MLSRSFASCSIAPERSVSVVTTRTAWPASRARAASLAVVTVLPTPGPPTSMMGTGGRTGSGRKPNRASSAFPSERAGSARPSCPRARSMPRQAFRQARDRRARASRLRMCPRIGERQCCGHARRCRSCRRACAPACAHPLRPKHPQRSPAPLCAAPRLRATTPFLGRARALPWAKLPARAVAAAAAAQPSAAARTSTPRPRLRSWE